MSGFKTLLMTAAALCCFSGAARAATERTSAPLPAPDHGGVPTLDPQENYKIGPLDVLDITVWQVESLNRTVSVDASGEMDFPLIGTVHAAGKTPRELGKEMAARLSQNYLEAPQVSVSVKEQLSQRFTIEGSVKTPGIFPVIGQMTLLGAIATAQGVDDFAKMHDVVIFRVVNNTRMAGVVDLGGVQSGKYADPQIYAGDVIVVPSSGARHAWHDIIASTPLLFFLHP
jgi:polysaccharide export outer membrane protein